MTETKAQSPEILSLEWKRAMIDGIDDVLQNYELFGQINFAPESITENFDKRSWPELTDQEREWITTKLFQQFGFDKTNPIEVAKYTFEAPKSEKKPPSWEGTASVKVFETQRSKLENMYLHEIQRPNTEVEYIIAPKDFQL